MLFRFNGYGYMAPFVFKAFSYEDAESFICMLSSRFSSNREDGCDYVGNYISLLSTEGIGYKAVCTVTEGER